MRFSYHWGLGVFLIIFCLGTGHRQAGADQVFLTNGDRISGTLVTFTQTEIQLSSPHSGIIHIKSKYIQKLATDNRVSLELVSGERIIGKITPGDGVTVVVQSDILGTRVLALEAVKTIHPILPEEPPQVKAALDPLPSPPKTSSDKSDHHNNKNLLSAQLRDVRGKGSGSSEAADNPAVKSTEEIRQTKPIGQKPEDEEDIRKIFLRQNSVLLRPRQAEFEAGLTYLGNQSVSSVANFKFRQFQLPLTLRVGLLDRIEGFLAMPVAYAQQELSFADNSTKKDKFGVGDATGGLNFEIFREKASWPEIITTVRIMAPTGDQPQEGGLSLGSGHWVGTVGLQFIKTTDPIVLFWGFQYTHQFASRHFYVDGSHNVQPGETIGYNFGFGFAVNENISLSSQVSGSYQWETQTDGTTVSGSSSEPVSFRAALTYRISKKSYIEPSISIGLNSDTPNFVIGLSATRRF
jgi:hypothetical protein